MAYDATKPVTGGALVAADIRENFRALKEDAIVVANSANYGSGIIAGTKMLFFQAAAPSGWTQDTTQNDKALRVVSGSGGGSGGSRVLSSATDGNTTLTTAQIPAHTHTYAPIAVGEGLSGGSNYQTGSGSTGTTGGGGAHNHPLALAYIDVIVCTKN